LYDSRTQTLYYSNAGHNPLLVLKNNENKVTEEVVKGAAIGFLHGYKYKLGRLELQKGDILVYYTDGITEAENSKKELYGKERLKKVLEESKNMDSESIKDSILKSVDSFREGYEQVDDITLLVIKI
jgi:sigma-B regulation protein RsbU (phosphoserine phosphatase)